MSTTVDASASARVAATVVRLGGGGPRRIAESAGLVITHGDGPYLVTDSGGRLLDFATAMGVAAIGHANPVWSRAIAQQAQRLAACVLHTPEHAAYLERLAAVLPGGVDRVALYSGGAEAVEVAVRLAQSISGKRDLISFSSGFHGKTTGVRFSGGRFPAERMTLGVDWVHSLPYPLCETHDATSYGACDEDGAAALAGLERRAAELDGVAAVIVEPVLGTAGNRPPQRRFLIGLRELCDRQGWLLIVDESITGFGRLSRNFAVEWFGVRPDILVLGKAIGGGYPLSGVAAPRELWDRSLFAERSATSSSYGANPLACAAGIAVLDVIGSPGFLERVDRVGARLAAGLAELQAGSPYVNANRGVGMMLGFDLVDPDSGALAGPDLCLRLFRRCLDEGILIVGDVPEVRLNPPLVLTEAQADDAIAALRRALAA
ncbi:MAG TPA: aspartate aminotransferase family protein [Candidatus Dormibacteraeota bacterium]|nr:aspartate aminotransferase family protein [Candidatus Dormibacteraeota bacterium]